MPLEDMEIIYAVFADWVISYVALLIPTPDKIIYQFHGVSKVEI
jgi:hypothetical protein